MRHFLLRSGGDAFAVAAGLSGVREFIFSEVLEAIQEKLGWNSDQRQALFNIQRGYRVAEFEGDSKPPFKYLDKYFEWNQLDRLFDIKVTVRVEVKEANHTGSITVQAENRSGNCLEAEKEGEDEKGI